MVLMIHGLLQAPAYGSCGKRRVDEIPRALAAGGVFKEENQRHATVVRQSGAGGRRSSLPLVFSLVLDIVVQLPSGQVASLKKGRG